MGVAVGLASAVAVISATTVARALGVAVGIGVSVGCARAVAVISATTVARVSGAALGRDATGDETAAGAGSPQASDMSDTQRARASDRLRLWRLLPPPPFARNQAGHFLSHCL